MPTSSDDKRVFLNGEELRTDEDKRRKVKAEPTLDWQEAVRRRQQELAKGG